MDKQLWHLMKNCDGLTLFPYAPSSSLVRLGLTYHLSVAFDDDGIPPPLMLHIRRTKWMIPSSRTRGSPMMPQSALLVWCK